MAYGKDPANLKKIVPYGGTVSQQMGNATRRPSKPRRSGGGGAPYWANQFRPSESIPDTIRLIPGSYAVMRVDEDTGEIYTETLPWYEYVEHYYNAVKMGGICSAGPFRMLRSKRDACYGCDMFWEDFSERKRTGARTPNRISMREMYVFNVIDMGVFYKTEQLDKSGNPKVNGKTGEPFWEWKKLLNPNDPHAIGKETRKGKLMTWAMGQAHFNSLKGYADHISQHCATCGARGDDPMNPPIVTHAWQCSNEDCGVPVIRLSDTQLGPQQIGEVVSTPHNCRACGQTNFLEEVKVCGPGCGAPGQGYEPVRATIFDVDMQVKRQKSSDGNQTQLIVLATSNPKPVDPAFDDLVKKVIDLPARYSPTSLEDQSQLWNYTPPVNTDPTSHAQQYSR